MNWASVFLYLAMVVPWVTGVALAKGFWMTFGAVIFPPFAWVVVAQYLMNV